MTLIPDSIIVQRDAFNESYNFMCILSIDIPDTSGFFF